DAGERGAMPDELAESSWRLFDLLLRSALARVPAGELVVLVPDAGLSGLPFAALFDRQARRFLIERHPLIIAPSATLFVRAAARQRDLAKEPARSLLLLADPRPEEDPARGLSDAELPGAMEDAAVLRALYADATELTGPAATKAAFLRHGGEYST